MSTFIGLHCMVCEVTEITDTQGIGVCLYFSVITNFWLSFIQARCSIYSPLTRSATYLQLPQPNQKSEREKRPPGVMRCWMGVFALQGVFNKVIKIKVIKVNKVIKMKVMRRGCLGWELGGWMSLFWWVNARRLTHCLRTHHSSFLITINERRLGNCFLPSWLAYFDHSATPNTPNLIKTHPPAINHCPKTLPFYYL